MHHNLQLVGALWMATGTALPISVLLVYGILLAIVRSAVKAWVVLMIMVPSILFCLLGVIFYLSALMLLWPTVFGSIEGFTVAIIGSLLLVALSLYLALRNYEDRIDSALETALNES